MAFLDELGLEHLWSHILGRMNGYVQRSTTINGKSLNSNVILAASDVGADSNGSAASALTEAKTYTDTKIAALVNSAPETLDTLGEVATAIAENETVVTALNQAIGNKADKSTLTSHTSNTSNPHSVTKSQVGLGNVDNVKQYSASNPPPYPVTSVNGQTGEVSIKAVPACSTTNNGQFLRVVNGAAAWSTVPNAEEASF